MRRSWGAIYYSTCYQSVMRTSTRDPDNTNAKNIIVPDMGAALYLQRLFPGSNTQWLDVGIPITSVANAGGRPKKYELNADRVRHQRMKGRTAVIERLKELLSSHRSQDHREKDGGNTRAETPISNSSTIGMAVFNVAVFLNKYQSLPFYRLVYAGNDEFVEDMKAIHQNRLQHKEDNWLVSPATFDPALLPPDGRALENIVHTRHIYMDFENGDRDRRISPLYFPDWKMVVTNSYNHRAEKPRSG